MIEKIDGFEIYENKQSPRIINIDIGDEILNKLIFPFNKFDITALEYKPFTRFTIAKSLDDLSNNKLSKLINTNSFSVDSDFNVGVNSTSPDVKLDVGGAVLVTGISTFENTTQSTSSTTGALIVSGGVGIAKSLNVGGNLSVAGTITYDDVTKPELFGTKLKFNLNC